MRVTDSRGAVVQRLGHWPVTPEIAGSNPVGSAISFFPFPAHTRITVIASSISTAAHALFVHGTFLVRGPLRAWLQDYRRFAERARYESGEYDWAKVDTRAARQLSSLEEAYASPPKREDLY